MILGNDVSEKGQMEEYVSEAGETLSVWLLALDVGGAKSQESSL